jgi:maltose O-acetyltransferase
VKGFFKGFLAGGLYVLCNYVIANLPCWALRKVLYRLLGMKVGRHSRIMMKTIVTHPWKISIGKNTTVNEYCYLDGRGGLTIGDNVNVALRSMLITGTHDHRAKGFDYYAEPILIEDDVWIAVDAKVLNGCKLERGCVVDAGAVVMPHTNCEAGYMYGGIPARRIKERGLDGNLELGVWHMSFR